MNNTYQLDLKNPVNFFISKAIFTGIEDCNPEIEIKKTDMNFRIEIIFELYEKRIIDDIRIDIYPSFTPHFNWSPHLTPTEDHIVSQHAFKSPALIVSDSSKQLVVIPDLDAMITGSGKWYMDMNAVKNRLTVGLSDYEVDGHVLYTRKGGTVYPKGKHKLALYLMVSESPEDLVNPFRKILSFLWDNWGRKLYEKGHPVEHSLDCYVNHTYNWAFNNWGKSVWQEFDLDGCQVGAPSFIVNYTQSPNYPGEVNERETRSIWNQAWFSSLRSAQGVYRYGLRTGNKDLIQKALLSKELALSAPQKDGLFPSVIATEMKHVSINGKTYLRSEGWDTRYWGNSNRNPLYNGDIKSAPYHLLDMSWTALLMLTWYSELEADERLKDYALRYADRLIGLQFENGFFPAWLDTHTLEPLGILNDSPESSLSATFLLKAYEMTKDVKYLKSASKAIGAIRRDCIFQGRWEDFETYWSCCPYGNNDLVGEKVKRNNMYKQCNFSMYWTAEALYCYYKATGDESCLRLGQRCLDEMLMTQASWQPPFIHINTLGGFGVMNADGEWNDARQSLFAELIILYGKELGINEYIKRGLAAIKASFVMMYCPENPRTKEQWEKRWPFFNEKDYGFMMENYGHDGKTDPNGLGIGEFTIYDWGNGAASEAYMRILDHFGEEFADFHRTCGIPT